MAERLAATALPRKGRHVAAVASAQSSGEGVLGARVLAYTIDSVLLGILSVAFVAAGALFMLVKSDWGQRDPPDSAQWGFVYASLAVVPAWFLVNLALLGRRRQSAGQYVLGLRVAGEDLGEPRLRSLVVYLLALNPLVFHPALAMFWGLFALVALSRTSSDVLVLGSFAVALLCLVAPLIALATAAADGGHRALHDRVAATKVVRLE